MSTEYPAPTSAGEWSLSQIEQALSRPLPPQLLEEKPVGRGNSRRMVGFIPWHKVVWVLNKYAPGWSWEITQIQTTGDRIFLVGKLIIPTSTGTVSREATGTEKLSCSGYGDPSSNAESMAFRRAAAKFGLGLSLYSK